MTIRSLFVKIFLWFWLANTVVIAVLALVVWLYPFSGTRGPHPGPFTRLHEMQVRGALAVRALHGEEAFEQHAAAIDEATGVHTYYLDEDGRDLRGQTVPENLSNYLRDHQQR